MAGNYAQKSDTWRVAIEEGSSKQIMHKRSNRKRQRFTKDDQSRCGKYLLIFIYPDRLYLQFVVGKQSFSILFEFLLKSSTMPVQSLMLRNNVILCHSFNFMFSILPIKLMEEDFDKKRM